ncbi:MAG: DNA polymerase III subunit gamma/tau, partial [Parcubacteria group bacterium]
MSSTLYRKYRPKKFSEIVGQKHIVRTLSNAIAHDRIGQAYLFTGPRGTGKTTIARIFAKAANCLDIRKTPGETVSSEPCLKCGNCKQFQEDKFTDIIEIDAASNTGVDNIRDLRETARLSPLRGKFKVYIIDEVHMLSQGAFNALLKILEEPPAHVIFILATTEIHKVPETIISRCQRFDFSKFTVEEIIEKLSAVAKKEKIKIDKEATGLIALMAEGGMRDAESLLEQIITLEKNDITSKKIEALLGVSGIKSIEKMTDLVFAGKTGEALIFVNKIYRDGYNLEIFSKSWLDYLRKMMLFKAGPELEKQIFSSLTKEQRESLKNLSARTGAKNLLVLIDRLSESIPKIKTSFIPQLPLEYLIVDLTGKSEEKN